MEENGSTASLHIYKIQLLQVNEALKHENNESSISDLVQLRDDLTQLISLTEGIDAEKTSSRSDPSSIDMMQQEEGLSNAEGVSKQDFDGELGDFYEDIAKIEESTIDQQKATKDKTQKSSLNDELKSFYSEISEKSEGSLKESDLVISGQSESERSSPNEKFLDSIEKLDDISGVKCQAPFSTDWAGTQHHNAMIKGPADQEKSGNNNDIRVKVLFLNPTMKTMQPCPYYLDGDCKFDVSQCRFSHGHIVSLYDLRPFVTPDYTKLKEGSRCVAKMADGLWKPGIIEKIEDHFYHIKFLHKDTTLFLELNNLLPQVKEDAKDDEVALSDGDEDIVTEIIPSSNLYSKYGESSRSGDQPDIGLWEEHTRGIGLKLLQKMGYKLGEGLGKLAQGRVEPVPIVVLPRGKSLDHCMKVREEKGVKTLKDGTQSLEKDVLHRRKRHRGCVFSFLNKTLGDGGVKTSAKKNIEKPKDIFGIKEGKDKTTTKNFNKEMFKNDEEMKKIQGKIQKVKESLRRNQGNASVTKSLRVKLDVLKSQLKDSKEYDSTIKVHKSRMETHRKMTVF